MGGKFQKADWAIVICISMAGKLTKSCNLISVCLVRKTYKHHVNKVQFPASRLPALVHRISASSDL